MMKHPSRVAKLIAGIVMCLGGFATTGAFAAEGSIPAPFRENAKQKTVELEFPYWSYILKATVFDAGRSDRRGHDLSFKWDNSRARWGNKSKTAMEGNRLYFQAFDDQNLEALVKVRERMEKLPTKYAFDTLTRDQQLAYWLNLYNVTLVEHLVKTYPTKRLQDTLYGDGSLLDQKLLNVAGVPLSLNDIHHRILIPKWRDPLVMYGLFHGYVSSPNLRREAYTAENVYDLLADNAKEFVNSIRGVVADGSELHVAELYEINAALFPNWDHDLRAHLNQYLNPGYAALAGQTTELYADTQDYYIADLSLGITMDRTMGVNLGEDIAGYERTVARGGRGFPGHVIAYASKVQKKKSRQKATVSVEEVDDSTEKTKKSKDK
ncbi:DUF547 domain-containing protein [Kordiimonas sp.]|uniref:DUF547 domain-containing protein n=1 Tax=Kordiimonas sp. TaxID=1970157 RepID=UPI003A8DDB1B